MVHETLVHHEYLPALALARRSVGRHCATLVDAANSLYRMDARRARKRLTLSLHCPRSGGNRCLRPVAEPLAHLLPGQIG